MLKLPLIPLLLFFSCHPQADKLTGTVINIADGDTFTLLVNSEKIKVRLYGIDCPERKQDFYAVAKTFLSEHVKGKTVSVEKKDTDRYGRIVGIVTVDGVNVNEALLKAGLAWHYKTYDDNPAWAQLEQQARQAKKGLWSIPNPIPPWEWRRKK